ncbi:MAG: molecular chaperone Skp [Acidobacteria bacterium]|nr:MAG: molecular chaperone Skp [Acidobacteriota bacterium]PYV75442.1 MAG: molecular chaperone Skp [Acidobacteriota bacterium]PYV76996.1 MAG: molecular chaperone Skp [Acidobacteriota bacterium]
MKPTLMRSLTAMAVLASAVALAQTDPAASSAALPAAPSAATSSAPAPVATPGGSTKIGTINIEAAIFASNEGQRDGDAVAEKLKPKQNELKAMNDEIEGLKKQLNTQGASLSDDAKAELTKKIEQKQKTLERNNTDLQEEVRGQENEIAQRVLRKMGPLIVKYAGDNAFGLIIDTSTNNQWPNGPVLWQNPAIDITKPIVDAYNVQSGVAPPAKPSIPSGTSRPGGTGLNKPATPAAPTTKPPATQPKQ